MSNTSSSPVDSSTLATRSSDVYFCGISHIKQLNFLPSCFVCLNLCDALLVKLSELPLRDCSFLNISALFLRTYRNNDSVLILSFVSCLGTLFCSNPCLQILNFPRLSFFSSDLNFCNPLNKTLTCGLSDNKVFHILSTELFSSLSFPHSACLQKFSCNFPSNTDRPCVTLLHKLGKIFFRIDFRCSLCTCKFSSNNLI